MVLLQSAAIQWTKKPSFWHTIQSTFLRLNWQEVFFKIFTYTYFMNSEALSQSSDCWHVTRSNKMYAKKELIVKCLHFVAYYFKIIKQNPIQVVIAQCIKGGICFSLLFGLFFGFYSPLIFFLGFLPATRWEIEEQTQETGAQSFVVNLTSLTAFWKAARPVWCSKAGQSSLIIRNCHPKALTLPQFLK